ncbi:MAG: phosphatidate cytidylyltransferase [Acidobacteriaceae bacterium]|nr:phosphatidate cytidylyltransferase [Acidobacteriaceae bacterium]MBV9499624.1 phosphatidate cytidylyltransferase [Acidobacteriaceae bacterium]
MRRLITAIGLLALALYLIFGAPQVIFTAATVCMGLLCYWEYSALVAGHAIRRPGVYGILAGLLLLLPARALSAAELISGLTVMVVVAFISSLRQPDLRDILPQVACALLGAFYAFAPWRFAAELRHESVHLLFFALALNWAGDTVAYYAGRAFGRHKLAPEVSPKKTWEGAIASVIGSVGFGVLYLGHFLPSLAWWEVALIAAIANVAGQFGDLAESAMKRGAGLKDSGTMLPGHGGMLDRVDSSLFALPVVYVLYFFIETRSA